MARKAVVKPNGELLSQLRKERGGTLKLLLRETAITAKTFQRAERGEPIQEEHMQNIATLFGRALSDLVLASTDERADAKFTSVNDETQIKLLNLKSQGGIYLASKMKFAPVTFVCRWDINPNSELAEEIAGFMEHLEGLAHKMCRIALKDSEFIRVVGRLNDMAEKLFARGVFVYVNSYVAYSSGMFTPRDDTYRPFRVPRSEWCVGLLFSSEDTGSITLRRPKSLHEAFDAAASINVKSGITPDYMRAVFEEEDFVLQSVQKDFLEFYAEYFSRTSLPRPEFQRHRSRLRRGRIKRRFKIFFRSREFNEGSASDD